MTSGAVAEYRRPDLSQLDYTYDLISGLSDDELEAVQSIAMAFIKKNKVSESTSDRQQPVPFQPQTEEQLLARIDHSLSQIESGEYSDAESVEQELLSGINE